jgi:DNA helicase HerA-like ATPase
MRKIIPLHAFKKHGYIVASSGSGKSELIKILIYRELVNTNPNSSVIVIDPH